MQKLDQMRGLHERGEGAESMTHSSHMAAYIPKVEAKEFDLTMQELHEQRASLTLDGTRRNGEAIAGVACWCSKDYDRILGVVCGCQATQ